MFHQSLKCLVVELFAIICLQFLQFSPFSLFWYLLKSFCDSHTSFDFHRYHPGVFRQGIDNPQQVLVPLVIFSYGLNFYQISYPLSVNIENQYGYNAISKPPWLLGLCNIYPKPFLVKSETPTTPTTSTCYLSHDVLKQISLRQVHYKLHLRYLHCCKEENFLPPFLLSRPPTNNPKAWKVAR